MYRNKIQWKWVRKPNILSSVEGASCDSETIYCIDITMVATRMNNYY